MLQVKFHISEGYIRSGVPESFESELLARLLEASSAGALPQKGAGGTAPDGASERALVRQFSMQKVIAT